MNRVLNFSAGPSVLPLEVLKEAQEHLIDFHGLGYSIMEVSHRGKVYDEIHNCAISLIKELYNIPSDFEVLFMQGGASMQFATIPLNLSTGKIAQFSDTGVWSSKAIKEAIVQNIPHEIIASSKDTNFDRIPENIEFSDDADYAYITSNNTIYGTQYKKYPISKAPLVVDASSDVFSYEINWNNVKMLFAGAQKNAGPSGVTLIIIHKSLLNRVKENVPTILRYQTYAKANSLYNTPPTFAIYLLGLTMKWIKKQGGIKAIKENNQKKANLLYDFIDSSNGFYVGHAQKSSRSNMNVVFNIKNKDEKLESELIEFAGANNMIGLKGHRHLGGLRASIYNAVSLSEVKNLVDLMSNFMQSRN